MKRNLKLLIAASLLPVAAPLFGAERGLTAMANRSSGGQLAISVGDAYALNLDARAGNALRLSYWELVTTENNVVRFYNRKEGEWIARSAYAGDSDVLAVEDGTRDHQVLVLDGTSLKVVDFSSDPAKVIGSFGMQNLVLRAGGHYVERFGSFVYVVDASLPGFRVLTMARPDRIEELTSFRADVTPSEIRARDGVVYVVGGGRLSAVAVRGVEAAETALSGVLDGSAIQTVAFDAAGEALVADGSSVHVVDADPSSPAFLRIQRTVRMPAEIDRLVIQGGQAFLFDSNGALEVLALGSRSR